MFEFLRRRKVPATPPSKPKALPAAGDGAKDRDGALDSLDSLDMSSDDVLAVDLDPSKLDAATSLPVATSVIGQDMEVQGPITTASPLQIAGAVTGDITAGDEVTVNESGRVHGKIQATRVTVRGIVRGPVTSSGRLSIASTGQVHGDVIAKALHVDDGGQLQGRCSMKSE